jgi:hypothetical protein
MLETASMPLAEDEATLQRARDGDRDAFADLVRLHQAMVFSIAYHFTGARDVAEELSQDVFSQAVPAPEGRRIAGASHVLALSRGEPLLYRLVPARSAPARSFRASPAGCGRGRYVARRDVGATAA